MIEIRRAKEEDVHHIHKLSRELGYDTDIKIVKENLQQMLSHPDYEVVVVIHEQSVAGWMSLATHLRLEGSSYLQITALVVTETLRGRGLGKALLKYAENHARLKKLSFIGLYSNKKRSLAHDFYKNQGYMALKESYFFTKELF